MVEINYYKYVFEFIVLKLISLKIYKKKKK